MDEPMFEVAYRGYTIVGDGRGFYLIRDPLGQQVATCEGGYTARDVVDDKIAKVYGWYNRTSNLSPLQAQAAALLTSSEAEAIILAADTR